MISKHTTITRHRSLKRVKPWAGNSVAVPPSRPKERDKEEKEMERVRNVHVLGRDPGLSTLNNTYMAAGLASFTGVVAFWKVTFHLSEGRRTEKRRVGMKESECVIRTLNEAYLELLAVRACTRSRGLDRTTRSNTKADEEAPMPCDNIRHVEGRED